MVREVERRSSFGGQGRGSRRRDEEGEKEEEEEGEEEEEREEDEEEEEEKGEEEEEGRRGVEPSLAAPSGAEQASGGCDSPVSGRVLARHLEPPSHHWSHRFQSHRDQIFPVRREGGRQKRRKRGKLEKGMGWRP